jgi:hypothetical protein
MSVTDRRLLDQSRSPRRRRRAMAAWTPSVAAKPARQPAAASSGFVAEAKQPDRHLLR